MSTEHDTGEVKYYAVGPGRKARRTSDPIDAVYADGPIDRDCRGCGADAGDYCRHTDGTVRKIPCPQRFSERNT
ncbi:hypothetical protein [Mycolicibacterium mageritense]|uniref:hypothetical protein n=1 Tax=Mycolicibacterium mageritense TaxID=53462 RepID=UPI001E2FC3FB|nr:hypothetical protein [Mycolicibacterium mageritense]MCC9182587.1 hypothetical protein [Mycolicibacterium mageritense]